MTKRCSHCATDIPFVANRCPNCTTVLNIGSSEGEGFIGLIIMAMFIVFCIGNCLGIIK